MAPRKTDLDSAPDWATITEVLKRRFEPSEIQSYEAKGQKLSYISSRQAMERLDEAVGIENWSSSFTAVDVPTGAIECTITIHGVSKSDIGYPNSPVGAKNNAGKLMSEEPFKDAYSDSFKRACVQWGIGRQLYEKPGKPAAVSLPPPNPVYAQVREILADYSHPKRTEVREFIATKHRPLEKLGELADVPNDVLAGALAVSNA